MEDLLNNENEVNLIKTRIVTELPKINQIIETLRKQIDPALCDSVDEFKRRIESELKSKNDIIKPCDSSPTVEEIDEFFRELNCDKSTTGSLTKPGKGKKITRALSVHPKSLLSETRAQSLSLQSLTLTPSASISGTSSQQNLKSLIDDSGDGFEIDKNIIKQLATIQLKFNDNVNCGEQELVRFSASCTKLDQYLQNLKFPKEERIKLLTVNPETNRLVVELNKAINNLISILKIDLKNANTIFDYDGELFPLNDELTEIYQ